MLKLRDCWLVLILLASCNTGAPTVPRADLLALKLQRAVEGRDIVLVKEALREGAPLSHPSWHEGILHIAIESEDLAIFAVLLEAGAPVNEVAQRARGSTSELASTARITPLYLALADNRQDMVQRLLDRGADPTLADEYGLTPLHLACGLGRFDMIPPLLAHGADWSARDTRGFQPNDYLLLLYFGRDDIANFTALITQGARPDVMIPASMTSPLHMHYRPRYFEFARLLLEHGCPVDIQNNQGETPLVVAATAGLPEMMELLLAYGADANYRLPDGHSVLHSAAWSCPISGSQSVAVTKLLLAAGADPHAVDGEGQTPRDVAQSMTEWYPKAKQVVELLEKAERRK